MPESKQDLIRQFDHLHDEVKQQRVYSNWPLVSRMMEELARQAKVFALTEKQEKEEA